MNYLGFAFRQMKLASADIDPHIGVGHHQIGVAGEPKPGHIKQCRQTLVRNLHVDMFEMDRVTKIFGGAIEFLVHGRGPGCGLPAQSIALSSEGDTGWREETDKRRYRASSESETGRS